MFPQLWRIWRPPLLHGSAASMEGLSTLIQGICNNRFLGVRVADASTGRNGNTGVHVWRGGECTVLAFQLFIRNIFDGFSP